MADWNINDLYSQALRLVKKNKVLWLFGMAVAANTSLNINSRSSSGRSNTEMFQNNQQTGDLGTVLGAATDVMKDTFAAIFSLIPSYFYVIAGLEFLFLIITGIILSIIYRSWAEASLIEGIQTAIAKHPVSIHETSAKAFRSIKDVALVRLVPTIGLIVATLVIILPLVRFQLGPLIFLAVLGVLVAFVLISFSQIWAVRKVVINKTPAKKAFVEGYQLTRKKFWPMVFLAIVNNLLKFGIVLCLVIVLLAPGIGIAVGSAGIIQQTPELSVPVIAVTLVLIFAFVAVAEIVSGIMTAFIDAVWSLAYQKIKGTYEK